MTGETSPLEPKPRTWKDLGVRIVSAIVLVILAYIPLYFGGWLWTALIALFGARMMYEWVRMSDKDANVMAYALPIIGLTAAVTLCALQNYQMALIVVGVTALLAAIIRLPRGGLKAGLTWAGLGSLYIAIPIICILWLRGFDSGWSGEGFRIVAFIIVVTIGADAGAYFGGSYFKGPKMAPKLSPNKSWSGFFSGLLAGALLGAGMAWVMDFSPAYGAMLAVPVAILSVVGDFLESGLKRKLKVKDTGGLLPGHGGVLDRIDSLMVTVVVVSFALIAAPGIWPT